MDNKITTEVNATILISILKQHNITKVVASPGTTNVAFIGSIQNDPYFTLYSAVDERSAAYLACGIAEESGEPIVISCTGATASRNYAPGLTEAYYRKLPILAVTSTQALSRVGHNVAQVIDRSEIPKDVAKYTTTLPVVKDGEDKWDCEIKVNNAILELTRHGGGPVHINLPSTYSLPFIEKEVPKYRCIRRYFNGDQLPKLGGKVAVSVGSHPHWTAAQTEALDKFCEVNDAVVFCDHTSGYYGKYRVVFSLIAGQEFMDCTPFVPDITICLGEVSGDYYSHAVVGKQVWRVAKDGEIRDTFKKLKNVFEMDEISFLNWYSQGPHKSDLYLKQCRQALSEAYDIMPDLPFSNIWIASILTKKFDENSVIHFGILNSLRSWNLFDFTSPVKTNCNVGGFGIDGVMSSLIGASLCEPNKNYYCVLGDLAFFYDMNVLGNRHVGRNVRILVVNNGKGTEFKLYNHHAAYFGEQSEEYISAAGHFGNKSSILIRQYVEALGFEYITASNKNEFTKRYPKFLSNDVQSKPMVFEVFTESEEESQALELMLNIKQDKKKVMKSKAKNLLGEKGLTFTKRILRR